MWLQFELDGSRVSALKCTVCAQFQDKLRGCKNFTQALIVGSRNIRSSAFKGHEDSDMHKQAMSLLRQGKSTHVSEYAPIAKVLTTLDPVTEARLSEKFDFAYLLAKDNLSFKEFVAMAEQEERHEVDLGISYRNEKSPVEFVSYIAQTYVKELETAMSSVHFFSIQADGSKDHANVENEVFLAFYVDQTHPYPVIEKSMSEISY